MKSANQKALVTGGAGFIGSHLVRRLLDAGIHVTVLDNLSVGRREAVDSRAKFVRGDIRSPDDVKKALSGVDCIFHLAAQVTIRGSFAKVYDDVDSNLMGTVNILRSVDPDRIRRFILASSMAVYADAALPQPVDEDHPTKPISPYGVSKLASELICSQVLGPAGVPFTALRYFNTYGPGQKFTPYVGVITIFCKQLLAGQVPVIFGDGEQVRDFVHVNDIVTGTVSTLEGPEGIYNLGTGRGTTVNRLARLLIDKIAPEIAADHEPERPGELKRSVADIGRASRKLGYTPQHALDTEIDGLIEYIRHN